MSKAYTSEKLILSALEIGNLWDYIFPPNQYLGVFFGHVLCFKKGYKLRGQFMKMTIFTILINMFATSLVWASSGSLFSNSESLFDKGTPIKAKVKTLGYGSDYTKVKLESVTGPSRTEYVNVCKDSSLINDQEYESRVGALKDAFNSGKTVEVSVGQSRDSLSTCIQTVSVFY